MSNVTIRPPDAHEINEKRAAKLRDVAKSAPRYKGIFKRAFDGNSLRAAISAFCCECMGYAASEVESCTSLACPLYPYRNGSREGGNS